MNSAYPEVSVVIPVFNEEEYIRGLMDSLLKQDYDMSMLEIILVDGVSTDKTAEIIEEYQQIHSVFKLLQNPKQTVQHALNIGMKAAQGKYIVRMDAHSEYADNYISKCVEYLNKTDAVNVGGPMIAEGKTPVQKAIAAAYHSKFALGGGKNHDETYEGYADTVYLGAFKKKTLEEVGYYDKDLIRNEDDDLNFRLKEKGYKIYITPEIKSTYYPRCTYRELFKQYFEYGEWKVAVRKKHGEHARKTHYIPLLFVLLLVLGGIASILSPFIFNESCSWVIPCAYGVGCGLYLLIDIIASFSNKRACGFIQKLRLVWIHIILHISYGCGYIKGIFRDWNFSEKDNGAD